jgi:hypothetical protein
MFPLTMSRNDPSIGKSKPDRREADAIGFQRPEIAGLNASERTCREPARGPATDLFPFFFPLRPTHFLTVADIRL